MIQALTPTTGAMADQEQAEDQTLATDEPKSPEPASPTHTEKKKIDLLLKAAGDAPIMKKKKWAVDPNKKVGWVTEFIKKYIKCEPHESVFLYVNQSFSPAPDRDLRSLFNCFGSDGKLILHYCKSQAWG